MAIARVAATAASSANAASVTTGDIDTSSSTLLVAALGYNSGSGTFAASDITSADNKGNTWTALTAMVSSFNVVQLFYCVPTSVGASHHLALASLGVQTYPSLAFWSYSGSHASSPFDQENGTNDNSLTAGSITPSTANCLLVTAMSTSVVPGTIDSGYTYITGAAFSGAIAQGIVIAELIQTTATAKNPTWTNVGGPVVVHASFKPAAVASSTSNNLLLLGVG